MFYALTENFGNLREKLNLFIAFAPIAVIGDKDENSIYTAIPSSVPHLLKACNALNIHEFFGEKWERTQHKLSFILSEKQMNAIQVEGTPITQYVDEERVKIANKRK